MRVKKMWLDGKYEDHVGWRWENHYQKFQGNRIGYFDQYPNVFKTIFSVIKSFSGYKLIHLSRLHELGGRNRQSSIGMYVNWVY